MLRQAASTKKGTALRHDRKSEARLLARPLVEEQKAGCLYILEYDLGFVDWFILLRAMVYIPLLRVVEVLSSFIR